MRRSSAYRGLARKRKTRTRRMRSAAKTSSPRRIFDRVLEQISEDLLETVAVAGDHRPTGGHVDMETTVADRRVMALHDIANERCPRNRFAANLQTSGFDARHIEQLEDQTRHPIDLIQRDIEILLRRLQVLFADQRLRQLRVSL